MIILGLFSLDKLEIFYFPALKIPQATIVTRYDGASQDLIEQEITNKIESSIALTPGVDTINSYSYSGTSIIYVKFTDYDALEKNLATLKDKVTSVIPNLPENVKPPYVIAVNNGSHILNIGLTSDSENIDELGNLVYRKITPELQQTPGVGGVGVTGTSDYALRIWLLPDKMAAYNITASDVVTAVKNNNISFPGGTIRSYNKKYVLVSNTQLKNTSDFQNIILKNSPSKGSVKLKDIAIVSLGTRALEVFPTNINGTNGILLQISPRDTANPLTVANLVKEKLKTIEKQLPSGTNMEILQDNSIFLKKAIDETTKTIFEAIILVILVVFLFLGSLRASLVPIVTIPVCLITTFAFIKLLGFSINIMTLLALVLSIGLVVDDAIVMVENIHSYIEKGKNAIEAAITGSKQITFSVIAMTITLAVVYAPIGLATGPTAVILQQFAFTLAISVIISGFVALTLSPMMCAYTLQSLQHGKLALLINKILNKIVDKYQKSLAVILNHRLLIMIITLIIVSIGGWIYNKMPASFLPKDDIGIFGINLDTGVGTTFNYTEPYVKQVENILLANKNVSSFFLKTSSSSAGITVVVKPFNEIKLTTQQVMNQVSAKLKDVAGIKASAYTLSAASVGDSNAGIQIYFMGNDSYIDIMNKVKPIVSKLKTYPGFDDVSQFLKFNIQDYQLNIKRELAADLGINIQDIASTIQILFAGKHQTDLQTNQASYPVQISMNLRDLKSFQALERVFLPAQNKQMVPLSSLVTITQKISQSPLPHYQQSRTSVVYVQLNEKYSIGEAAKYLQQELPKITPRDLNYAYGGALQEFIESSGSMLKLFLFSIICIYLVLSAQFESFIDPFVILIVVPLSIVGAIFAIRFTSNELSVFTNIGFVTLIGLVSKHGILITQFTNELRQKEESLKKALIKAASSRLRPIIMTSLAMILGSLPLAFSTGIGSASRQQIGWTLVGGLCIGTIFSLYIVPIVYLSLDKLRSSLSFTEI